jgi:hypothetical protein
MKYWEGEMRKYRSSISKAGSHKEIGEFWDIHDLTEFWRRTRKASFDVDIQSEAICYPLDKRLADQVQFLAMKRGISADTLVDLWVQEKLQERNV